MKIEDYFEQKKQETNKSFAFFVKKVPHSEECPYGIDICSDFDPDKPLVLLLAGTSDKRDVLRACNSLLKKTENFIFGSIPSAKKNLLLCAAVCHFGKYFNPDIQAAYKQVEKIAGQRLISTLPEIMQEEYT